VVTAVIPCGGQGTRIAAVARGLPKELLPVAGKPLLEWTLEEATAAGLGRAIVVSSPEKAAALQAHLASRPAALATTIVLQPHARGLGDENRDSRRGQAASTIQLALHLGGQSIGRAVGPCRKRNTGHHPIHIDV
jgi:UTP--glucose-1-phosphate uridylyltransferase